MDTLETVRLSLSAIRRNKSRSFLTMLGIIIGVFAVISLVSLGTGLQNYITQQFESLGTNIIYVMPGKVGGIGSDSGEGFSHGAPNFAGSKLKISMIKEIEKLGSPITGVTGQIENAAVAKFKDKTKSVTVAGATPEYFSFVSLNIKDGRIFNSSEVGSTRKVAVLGPEVAMRLYGNNSPLGEEVIVNDSRFRVIGVLESRGAGMFGGAIDSAVYIPITCAQQIFGTENLQAIMIKFKDKDNLDEVKYKVKSYLLRTLKEDDFSMVNQGAILSTISSILNVLTLALGGIAAISLLVGGIGIMNIMLVSVTERTREIGIRKSVGAKNSDILAQFLVEAVFLSLVGGGVGVFLGILGTVVVGKLISANAFSWWSLFLALGVSAGVGIIFGVAPAAKAAKLDPVESLRYE